MHSNSTLSFDSPGSSSAAHEYARQQSSGLQLEGRAGEKARVRLPDFDFRTGEPPPLFLPVADVLSEAADDFIDSLFKSKDRKPTGSNKPLDSYTTPFTFLSNFLALDDTSSSDDGNAFKSAASLRPMDEEGGHALDQLAARSPSSDWVWRAHGFYDEESYALPEHSETGVVQYAEIKKRMPEAREQNKKATKFLLRGQSRDSLDKARDDEFGWRADASPILVCPKRSTQ